MHIVHNSCFTKAVVSLRALLLLSLLLFFVAASAEASPIGTNFDAALNLTVLPMGSPTAMVEAHESQPPNALDFTFDLLPELFPALPPVQPQQTTGKPLLVNETLTTQGTCEHIEFIFTAADGGTLHLNPIPPNIGSFFGLVDLYWDGGTQPPTVSDYRVMVSDGTTTTQIATAPSFVVGTGLPADPFEFYYLSGDLVIPDGSVELRFSFKIDHVPEPGAGWLLWMAFPCGISRLRR